MAARVAIVVLLLAGGFMLWRELEPLVRFRPVAAQVLSTGVEHRTTSGTPGARSRGARRSHSGYVPKVEYRYEVGGVAFVGDQYQRTPTLESARAARSHLLGILPGATITAWVNPSDPGEAVLSRAPNPILLAILAVMGVFCGLFSLMARRVRPAATAPGSIPPAGIGSPVSSS